LRLEQCAPLFLQFNDLSVEGIYCGVARG
jgi:hypothetical protein